MRPLAPQHLDHRPLDHRQTAACTWVEDLHDQICAVSVAIGREAGGDAGFGDIARDRPDPPHEPGGGGILCDHPEGDAAAGFAFTQAVGRARLASGPAIVRRRLHTPFAARDIAVRDAWRGRHAEFDLVDDCGPSFGPSTGGTVDAAPTSLPPGATWS